MQDIFTRYRVLGDWLIFNIKENATFFTSYWFSFFSRLKISLVVSNFWLVSRVQKKLIMAVWLIYLLLLWRERILEFLILYFFADITLFLCPERHLSKGWVILLIPFENLPSTYVMEDNQDSAKWSLANSVLVGHRTVLKHNMQLENLIYWQSPTQEKAVSSATHTEQCQRSYWTWICFIQTWGPVIAI